MKIIEVEKHERYLVVKYKTWLFFTSTIKIFETGHEYIKHGVPVYCDGYGENLSLSDCVAISNFINYIK